MFFSQGKLLLMISLGIVWTLLFGWYSFKLAVTLIQLRNKHTKKRSSQHEKRYRRERVKKLKKIKVSLIKMGIYLSMAMGSICSYWYVDFQQSQTLSTSEKS